MKKYLAIISALLMFAACDKSSDQPEFKTVGLIDEIKISDIETVTSAITEVAFVARFHGFNDHAGGFTDTDGKDTRVMLKVPFDAKGTTLVLPKNPPQELLGNIALDFPEGFEISNPEAKTIAFVEIACNISAQNRFSDFLYMVSDSENVCYEQTYIYCDRSATVTGTGEDWWGNRTVYNLNLQKGWNMVVKKTEQQNNSVTNLMPSGMKWKQGRWIGGR